MSRTKESPIEGVSNVGKKAGDKARAAGHATIAKRGAAVGTTERIRELLRAGEGWIHGLTKTQIAERTGLAYRTVSTAVSAQVGHNGGLVSFGKKGHRRYAMLDSPAARKARGAERRPSGEYAVALPIVVGKGFRWGAGY